jgi:hypothetical protein
MQTSPSTPSAFDSEGWIPPIRTDDGIIDSPTRQQYEEALAKFNQLDPKLLCKEIEVARLLGELVGHPCWFRSRQLGGVWISITNLKGTTNGTQATQ